MRRVPERGSLSGPRRLPHWAALAERHLGFSLDCFPPARLRLLTRRLGDHEVRPSPEVLRLLVELLCIGETWFLRDREQLETLVPLAHEVAAGRPAGSPVRVWSAGCATGEEAYSLAALLAPHHRDRLTVTGSDVNAAYLARARAGVYDAWSMRGLGSSHAPPWLEADEDRVRVAPEVAARVEFLEANLLTGPYLRDQHLVVCRNVLTYFTAAAAGRVLRALADSTVPGGVLLLGHGDPQPTEVHGWRSEWRGGHEVFRRTPMLARSREPVPSRPPVGARAPADPPGEVRSLVHDLATQEHTPELLECLEETLAESEDSDALLLGALAEAESGKWEAAIGYARRARFLAPQAASTNFVLGMCLAEGGHPDEARQRFVQARRALGAVGDLEAPLPHGGGMTGRQLDRLLARRMEVESGGGR